jgi:serine protease
MAVRADLVTPRAREHRVTRVVATAALAAAALTLALLPAPASAGPVVPTTPRPTTVTTMTAAGGADTAALAGALPAASQPPVRRLIVRTTTGRIVSSSITSATRSLAGVSRATVLRRLASGSSLVALSSPVSIDEAWRIARSLTARDDVVYAQPDLLMKPLGNASPVDAADPYFGQQWDLWDSTSNAAPGGGFSTKAPAAWARTRGRPEVVVAVLDTGITSHPELTGQTVPGYDFVSGDTWAGGTHFFTANDGNGRDSNPADPGDWISASEASSVFFASEGCSPDSSSWHGTHVAGTIVAKQDNGIGISGVAPGVKVQALRVLGKCGGYTSDIVDAIRWAAGDDLQPGSGNPAGVNPTPASVINLSLGASGPCDTETQDAITYAVAHGTTVVVAAGNDGLPVTSTSASTGSNPADCSGVIDVVATERGGARAPYSDYGVVAGSTVISAPGGSDAGVGADILSTVNTGTTSPSHPGYAWYAGTSMATPHVAAAAALLQSLRVGRTPYSPSDVAALLSTLTQPFPEGSGCSDDQCGRGILDLQKPLPRFVPLPPTSLVTQPAHDAVTVSWTPGDDGGNVLAHDLTYLVEQSPDGVTFSVFGSTTASSLQVTGLVDDTDYWFRVSAVSVANGSSPVVATGPVRPALRTRPQSPATPVVTGGIEHLAISWTMPPDGGDPITDYSVEYRLVGSAAWSCAVRTTPTDPQCLVPAPSTAVAVGWPTVLAAGTYEVRVAAQNVHGLGVYSPTTLRAVVSLVQSAAISGPTLRPLRDGFQDSVRVTASSNLTTAGSIRILDSLGHVVRTVPLGTTRAWAFVWTGLDQRARRVAYGRYHVQVLLRGRASTPTVLSTMSVRVSSSRASRPSILLSSPAVYPYPDRYLDTVTIRATATVPSSFTMRIVGAHGTVWSTKLSRRSMARAVWKGTTARHRVVAAGRYRLVVSARGGEGPAVSSSTTIVVSSKRVRFTTFDVVVGAASAPTMLLSGSISPYGEAGVSLDAPSTVIGVSLRLPPSVRAYADVLLVACTDIDNASTARASFAFLDETESIADGPWSIPNEHGCYVTPTPAPSPAVFSSEVHFAVANVPASSATDPWVVSAYEVTGTAYYLR